MARPAVATLFQARGIHVDEVHPNLTVRRNGGGFFQDFCFSDTSGCGVDGRCDGYDYAGWRNPLFAQPGKSGTKKVDKIPLL